MSGETLRITITAVLFLHGIGQIMGVLPAVHFLGAGTPDAPEWGKQWSGRSWLLTDTLGDPAGRAVCLILYGAAFLLFLAAACALHEWLLPYSLWRTFTLAGAVVSLIALFLFWNALLFLFPHKIGNIAVDIAALAGILVLKWPPDATFGM